MDAATTNKVLKTLTNPSKVLSKMRLSSSKSMKRGSALSSLLANSSNTNNGSSRSTRSSQGSTSQAPTSTVTTSSNNNKRRVRFNSKATVAETVEYYHQTQAMMMTPEQEQAIRWYDKKELHAKFLKDLEEHLIHQVHGNDNANDNANDNDNGRGLELHMAHNQRRKEDAERYVRGIVEKSHHLRKKGATASSSSSHNMMRIHMTPMMRARKRAFRDAVWAQELQEYASQSTWMSRDWALAEAALDEAQARAIYQEDEGNDEALVNHHHCNNAEAEAMQRVMPTKRTPSKHHSSDSINNSQASSSLRSIRKSNYRQNRPRSFTAKSA